MPTSAKTGACYTGLNGATVLPEVRTISGLPTRCRSVDFKPQRGELFVERKPIQEYAPEQELFRFCENGTGAKKAGGEWHIAQGSEHSADESK